MSILLAISAIAIGSPAFLQDNFSVAQPIRLAITPRIDGSMSAEEWDELSTSGNATSYLQWEPGILYGAAVWDGNSLAISLDCAGDGWLVGADNLEIRFVSGNDGIEIQSRLLDCTNRQGPQWIASPLVKGQIDAAGGDSDGKRVFEFKLFTTGLFKLDANTKFGVRFDGGPAPSEGPAPSTPRSTALVRMQFDRGIQLPSGMQWNSQYGARSVVPGESISVRLNFSSKTQPPFQRIDLRTIGLPNAATLGLTFPQMKRDRTFVDYKTLIPADTSAGYRVLEGKLLGGESHAKVESSYRVAETVVFDVRLPDNLVSQDIMKVVKGSVTIRSQTDKRLDGVLKVEAPDGWAVIKGTDSKFHIYFSRGSARLPLEFSVPAGTKGMIPIKFKAEIGTKIVETTYLYWIK